MNRVFLSLSAIASILSAAAYKLPEQSLDGLATSAANIASCAGADCAFYNPANISFLNENRQFIEAGLSFVHLSSVKFKGTQRVLGVDYKADAKSRVDNAAIGYLHYVSKAYGPWRYSLSFTVPAGLRKRWDSPFQKLYAKEFSLKTVMLNPSIAYKFNNNFSLAIGADIVYSEGKVYSDGDDANLPIKRQMKGDSIDYGFNIAAALHLNNGINLAATYRSKIKLSEKGKANLYFGGVGKKYNASVDIYIPAALSLAISKDFNKFSLEFVYERTFWSSYKNLDFNYDREILTALKPYFDKPIAKRWRDTNTFRLGLKYRYSNKLTIMAGYAYDESPIKSKYISYELPDSNAHVFSIGFNYKQNKNLTWGAGLLYDYKKKRAIISPNYNGIKGKFSNGSALLISAAFKYSF